MAYFSLQTYGGNNGMGGGARPRSILIDSNATGSDPQLQAAPYTAGGPSSSLGPSSTMTFGQNHTNREAKRTQSEEGRSHEESRNGGHKRPMKKRVTLR